MNRNNLAWIRQFSHLVFLCWPQSWRNWQKPINITSLDFQSWNSQFSQTKLKVLKIIAWLNKSLMPRNYKKIRKRRIKLFKNYLRKVQQKRLFSLTLIKRGAGILFLCQSYGKYEPEAVFEIYIIAFDVRKTQS